jgi:cytoskeletal protein CcmA (bactofilin family)
MSLFKKAPHQASPSVANAKPVVAKPAQDPVVVSPVYSESPPVASAPEAKSVSTAAPISPKETLMDKPMPTAKPVQDAAPQPAPRSTTSAQETIIGVDTMIEGKIQAKSELKINGGFKGEIISSDRILVGTSGRVEATIESKCMTISGKVVGNLRITERLEILATGEVFGDLETQPGALIIEKGAKIEGRLSMGLKPEA